MSAHSRPIDGTSGAESVNHRSAVATNTLRTPTPVLQSWRAGYQERIASVPPAPQRPAPQQHHIMHTMVRRRQRRTVDQNMVTHAVAICTFVASTALTGNTPASRILDACAITGVIGALCAVAAGTLSTNGVNFMAMRMLLLSYVCAVFGAIGMIAGTQSWKATLVSGVGTITIVAAVLRSATRRRGMGIVDAEVGIPRTLASQ